MTDKVRVVEFTRNVTEDVLGDRKLIVTADSWDAILTAIRVASPESQMAIASWDPEGKGFTPLTIVYDMANMSQSAIEGQTGHRSEHGIGFSLWVGDFDFEMLGIYDDQGVVLFAHNVAPHDHMDTLIVNMIRENKPVFMLDEKGKFENITPGVRASYKPLNRKERRAAKKGMN